MLSLSPYRVTHASSLALEEELKLSNYPHISERCLSALRWYGRSRVPQPELQRYCTRPSILGELKKWVITTAGHFQIYAYGHGSVGTYFIVGFEENRTQLTWNVVSAVVVHHHVSSCTFNPCWCIRSNYYAQLWPMNMHLRLMCTVGYMLMVHVVYC